MNILFPLVDVSICFTHIHFALLTCFKIRIYCRFTVVNHEVELDFVRTLQWGLHEVIFTWVLLTTTNLRYLNLPLLNQIPELPQLTTRTRPLFVWYLKLKRTKRATWRNLLRYYCIFFPVIFFRGNISIRLKAPILCVKIPSLLKDFWVLIGQYSNFC